MFTLMLLYFISRVFGAVSNCGSDLSKFSITTLQQDPADTIQAGQNLTLILKYSSFEEVTDGTVTTSITYNFIPLAPTLTSLCTSVICPLLPGEHDGSTSEVFPSGLSGSVTSKIVWKDTSGNELLCISSKLSVKN